MNRALASLLLVLAACPKSGDKPKPADPPPGRGDAQRLVPEPAASDGGVTTLPPAPPLPAVPTSLPPPSENPRITPEAVALGELLFHDPRLSADGSRSCASCHDPARGYAGGVENAANGKRNLRRTPALVNLRWVKDLGWDGRGAEMSTYLPGHLKGQLDAIEASTPRIAVVPTYRAHLDRVGGGDAGAVVQALEAYVLTRYEGDAPWDSRERTARTTPGAAASDPVIAGYQLFVGKAQCAVCHAPPLYTDGGFHRVIADPNDAGRGFVDPSRAGAFRTPTLRAAMVRGSYFHNGAKKSIDEVIAHYQAASADGTLDGKLARIQLTPDEARHLAVFLGALTTNRPAPTKPVLP